ncbi:MAG: hypothetical protein AAF940_12795 [Pseudomonadota bacterium]
MKDVAHGFLLTNQMKHMLLWLTIFGTDGTFQILHAGGLVDCNFRARLVMVIALFEKWMRNSESIKLVKAAPMASGRAHMFTPVPATDFSPSCAAMARWFKNAAARFAASAFMGAKAQMLPAGGNKR